MSVWLVWQWQGEYYWVRRWMISGSVSIIEIVLFSIGLPSKDNAIPDSVIIRCPSYVLSFAISFLANLVCPAKSITPVL